MAGDVGPEGFVRQLSVQASRLDARLTSVDIAVPTLVVSGSDDTVCPPEIQAELAAAIPGAVHVTIDGAGHMSPLDHPGEVAAALGDWLASRPGCVTTAQRPWRPARAADGVCSAYAHSTFGIANEAWEDMSRVDVRNTHALRSGACSSRALPRPSSRGLPGAQGAGRAGPPAQRDPAVIARVTEMLQEISAGGLDAVLRYAAELDHWTGGDVELDRGTIAASGDALDPRCARPSSSAPNGRRSSPPRRATTSATSRPSSPPAFAPATATSRCSESAPTCPPGASRSSPARS